MHNYIGFAEEGIKWALSGFQTRTPEEVAKIYDEQCSKCPFFNRENEIEGSCSICGCAIRREDRVLNKLLWATTRCPDNPPRWIEALKPSQDAPEASG